MNASQEKAFSGNPVRGGVGEVDAIARRYPLSVMLRLLAIVHSTVQVIRMYRWKPNERRTGARTAGSGAAAQSQGVRAVKRVK